MQGQVKGTALTVTREVSRAGDTLSYVTGTFRIQASVFGVAFAGSSVNFKPEAMAEVQKFIRYATRVHKEIAAGRGVPLQEELNGSMQLRTKAYGEGAWRAWYEGFFDKGVAGTTRDYAIKELRGIWKVIDHARIAKPDVVQQ
jgi:hypothetical protein